MIGKYEKCFENESVKNRQHDKLMMLLVTLLLLTNNILYKFQLI